MKDRRFHPGLILYGILILISVGLTFSCTGGGGSDEGIPAVVGAQKDGVDLLDDDPVTGGIQYTFYFIGSPFNIQLKLDSTLSALEAILFRSSTPLPGYLDLDSNTGIITVTPDNSEHLDTVEFWSEGATSGEDTSAQSLRIDFNASSS